MAARKSRPSPAEPTAPREIILRAALDILRERGAGALTVREIAAGAGCSTTGVYTWFGGKNGLVEAIFVDGFQRFGADQIAVAESCGERSDLLEELGRAYRRWALANPTHYMVMFGHAVPDFRPGPAAIEAAVATFAHLTAAAARTRARRRWKGEPAALAYHFFAGVHGYVSLELAGMDMAADAAERERRFEDGLRRVVAGVS